MKLIEYSLLHLIILLIVMETPSAGGQAGGVCRLLPDSGALRKKLSFPPKSPWLTSQNTVSQLFDLCLEATDSGDLSALCHNYTTSGIHPLSG